MAVGARSYLRELLGEHRAGRHSQRWIKAAEYLERHRLTNDIDDPDRAFGRRPEDWVKALRWERLHDETLELRAPGRELHRGIGMSM